MALALFLSFYGYSLGMGVVRYTRLLYSIKAKYYFSPIFNKLPMRSTYNTGTIHNKMAEKWAIALFHFVDAFIGGGLIYTFISNIGDWQAGVSLGILIMFAILRGASLLEDIQSKKEQRRTKKIENDQLRWENEQKRKHK